MKNYVSCKFLPNPMKDYSIENLGSKINSTKTKIYFKEVSSSYFNENYRAAIVTLYSVVINDIIDKLETLEELYSDETAKSILDEVKLFQSENPNSPDWEKTIIEKVKERTNLIDNVDYAHIQTLKMDRHLCAHPVIDKDEKLYTPNKEVVAAHIRNMLESLFLKPAILTKKILKTILIDIAEKKDLLIDDDSLEKYINAKYLNNLNTTVELSIFRDLWKFVFYLTNEDAEKNRLINYRTLYLIFKRNRVQCLEKLQSEIDYFSNISDNKYTIQFLIRFLSENESFYILLREDIKLLINKRTEEDFSAKVVGWFLSENIQQHFEIIKQVGRTIPSLKFTTEASYLAYKRLLDIAIAKGYKNILVDYIIYRYTKSRNYYDADFVFDNILQPNLTHLNEEDYLKLLRDSNTNNQVYGRNNSDEHHSIIKEHIINQINPNFDFTTFTNLY